MVLTFIKDQYFEGIEVEFYNKRTGQPINLTGGTAIFIMADRTKAINKVNRSATITDAVLGKVQYNPISPDFDTVNNYLGQFTITGVGSGTLKKIISPIIIKEELASS